MSKAIPASVVVLLLAIALVVLGDTPASAAGFDLFGTAERVTDPVNSLNRVVQITTTPCTAGACPFGGVRREFSSRLQVEDFSNQLSFHFRFTGGRSCGGGAPRIQVAIDTDGDGVSNGNAFGFVGPFPTFTGCPANMWQFEDLTDDARRWDLTQFNDELGAIGQPSVSVLCGSFVCTGAQVLTVFGNFPNHRVLRATLVDDNFPGSPAGSTGLAFYDNIELGDDKLQNPPGPPE